MVGYSQLEVKQSKTKLKRKNRNNMNPVESNIDITTKTPEATETIAVSEAASNIVRSVVEPANPNAISVSAETTALAKGKIKRRKYGTGLLLKRVVLKDGVPIGTGRPKLEETGRTVVYIPKTVSYDFNVFGVGVKFNRHTHAKSLKFTDREKFIQTYPKVKKLLAA